MRKVNDSDVAILHKILASLPVREREALEMYYVRGLDDIQVCRETGMGQSELRELRRQVRKQYMEARRSP